MADNQQWLHLCMMMPYDQFYLAMGNNPTVTDYVPSSGPIAEGGWELVSVVAWDGQIMFFYKKPKIDVQTT